MAKSATIVDLAPNRPTTRMPFRVAGSGRPGLTRGQSIISVWRGVKASSGRRLRRRRLPEAEATSRRHAVDSLICRCPPLGRVTASRERIPATRSRITDDLAKHLRHDGKPLNRRRFTPQATPSDPGLPKQPSNHAGRRVNVWPDDVGTCGSDPIGPLARSVLGRCLDRDRPG